MKSKILLLKSTNDSLQCLGSNIADARQARDWSQDYAARQSGMSRATYRAIELGCSSVAIGHYLSVLDLYGLAGDIKNLGAPHLDEEGRRLRGLKGRHER